MSTQNNTFHQSSDTLLHKPLSEFERKETQWFPSDKLRIPRGHLTLVVGDPGSGKSFVVLKTLIEAQIQNSHYRYLLICEDTPGDMIKPRVENMDGDSNAFEIVKGMKAALGQERGFRLTTDLHQLEKIIAELKPDAVYVDPLLSYVPGTNLSKGNEVREFLDPLAKLAEKYEFALICVIHCNKSDVKALYKAADSIQLTAVAKSFYLVGTDPEGLNYSDKVICHVKTNVGALSPSYTFRIEPIPNDQDQARLVWGLKTHVTADDLVKSFTTEKAKPNKLEVAKALLHGMLRLGPQPTAEIEALANEFGIKETTLKRAREELGVKSERVGGIGQRGWWVSYLPGYETPKNETLNPLTENQIETVVKKALQGLGYSPKNHDTLSRDTLSETSD